MHLFRSMSFYLAVKQLFPTGKRISFFAAISIVGVMLGVMVLLIVQSVMNGFSFEIRKVMLETNGDIRIESGFPIVEYKKIVDQVLKTPGVEAASPYAQGVVMLQYGNRPAFPFIRGIDLSTERNVVPIDQYMISGNLENFDDGGILVGAGQAASLGLTVGSTVEVYTPLMLEKLDESEVLLPRELTVVGIFETGWNQVDSKTVLCTLRVMQELYGLDHTVHGIAVRMKPGTKVDVLAQTLNRELKAPLHAYTAFESNRDFFFILRLEKTVLFFIILFVVLVASFSIMSSLMSTVHRKTREIGVLSAMGATSGQIALCYCWQGFIVGVTGTTVGTLLALLALHYRNGIVQTFARLTHSEEAFVHFYQFTKIPVEYMASDFYVVMSVSILIATLAGLIPAWRAARLNPVEALRYE
jgi:lipoprotein-releasing system permease protein